jgi:hypothetical protein
VVAEVKHYQLLLLLLVRLLINYHTATVLSRVSEQLHSWKRIKKGEAPIPGCIWVSNYSQLQPHY